MTSQIDSKALSNFITTPTLVSGLDRVKTVPLSRSLHHDHANSIVCFFSRHFVGTAVELLQSFARHLQFHLRILLEDLRISLAKQEVREQQALPSDLRPDREDT